MKRMNLYLLILSIITLIAAKDLNAVPQQQWVQDNDNYGILKLLIIDEETYVPVSEAFYGAIRDADVKNVSEIMFGGKPFTTDNRGYFSCKWRPGNYLLYFFPVSRTSKYCWDKNPMNYLEAKKIIQIEKGKITKVIKKAQRGGKIRLIMESKSGERINPIEIFGENVDCNLQIYSKSLLINKSETTFTEKDNFNDGEITLYSLCPDLYGIEAKFDGMGIPPVHLKNIEVKKKATTEVRVTIDLNSPTGIEGRILYTDGTPIENVRVGISGPEEDLQKLTASVYTDKNGHYRIVSLKEGLYWMGFIKQLGEARFLRIKPKHAMVNNGLMSTVEVVVNLPGSLKK